MDQLNMSFMDNDTSVLANRYYNEILDLLENTNLLRSLTTLPLRTTLLYLLPLA